MAESKKRVLRLLYHNAGGHNGFQHDRRLLNEIDIIMVGETWLHAATCDLFKLQGFKEHHCYHFREYGAKGVPYGGVSVFVKDTLPYSCIFKDSCCRSIVWVDFPTLKLKIAAVYMAPENSSVWARLGNLDPMEALREGIGKAQEVGYTVVIMGDLNARIGGMVDIPHAMTLEQHQAEPMADLLKGVYSYDGIPQERKCKDTKTNKRGKEFVSLCMDSGMVVINGRAGTDRDKGVFTFVPATETKEVGENFGSTIDLVCISANHFSDVSHFEVEDVEEKGKHAVIRVDLTVKEYERRFRGDKKKKRGGCKVCRPDVGKMAAYATKHFQNREDSYKKLHGDFLEGKVSATDVLKEVMEGIRKCVRLARAEAERKGKISGKKEENVGAAWYDEECRVVNERAQAARWRLRDAKREVPPLQKEELDAMQDQVKTMRGDFQRMARRKEIQQKHDVQKQLIRDYYSSSPKNFWDLFSPSRMPNLEYCSPSVSWMIWMHVRHTSKDCWGKMSMRTKGRKRQF